MSARAAVRLLGQCHYTISLRKTRWEVRRYFGTHRAALVSRRNFLPSAIDFAAFDSRRHGFLPNWQGVEDQIHIEGLEVFAHIGVPDEERATTQRLRFNLTLWPIRQMDDLKDEIERAVNYAAVCAEVKKVVEQRDDKLIETLANTVALHLLESFEIRRVMVELRKYILPEVEFVSVTVSRERPAR